jgi:diadenosine tetraphosphate (Ap4A) HIT family hydrolase
MADSRRWVTIDVGKYEQSTRANPCFICNVVDGTHHYPHQVVYRDDFCIAFLNRFPTLLGYCLVAPLEHRTAVVGEFCEDEYVHLQQVVFRLGRALSATVPTERLYVLSLGSDQGNAHVHWHVAPLPPGVPHEEQQFKALMMEHKGYLHCSFEEQQVLAARIRKALGTAP